MTNQHISKASFSAQQIRVSFFVSMMLLCLFLKPALAAEAPRYPLTADVNSIDGIMHAYYDVVSGPANNWILSETWGSESPQNPLPLPTAAGVSK
ncbi:hypothetical protein ACO0LC_19930 [Undibacterium sp. JH2W]|uniref:hypothetical protein n=1 Tax=Undibacterium sp. JH2W TaxID=3413037 RepID=UPI003BEF8C85